MIGYYKFFAFVGKDNAIYELFDETKSALTYRMIKGNQRPPPEQKWSYVMEKAECMSAIAWSGCMGFFFEDLPGCWLNLYGLYNFEDAQESLPFYIVTALQILECGMAINSFYIYGYEERVVKQARGHLEDAKTGANAAK